MNSDNDKRLLAFLNMLRQDNKQPSNITKNRNVSRQSLNTISGASNHYQHNHSHQQTQSKSKIYRPCMPHPQLASLIDEEKLNKGTSWNGLLQEQFKTKDLLSPTSLTSLGTNNNETATFNQFDPLRTLQFLTLELNSKLKTILPDQKCIHKITNEIHQAIKRLSCSVASSSSANSLLQERVLKKFNMRTQTDSSIKISKSSQTYVIDNLKIKKQGIVTIDDNTFNKVSKETINEEYKALEEQCSVLRNEKLTIYNELTEYKEEIVLLKQEVKQLDSKLSATEVIDKTKIDTLEKKCQYYENELEIINKTSNEKELQDVKKIDELNCQLKKSIEKVNLLEHENYENNKNLVLEKLEKEKLLLLLKLRDTHLSDIHTEFKSIQNLVTEQLSAIDNTCIKNNNNNNKILSPSSSLSEQQQKQLQEELERKFNIKSPLSDLVRKRRNKRKMCLSGTVPVIAYTKVQPITTTSVSSSPSSMSTTASHALSLLRKYKNDHKLVLQQQRKNRLTIKEQQPGTEIIVNHQQEFGDFTKRKFLNRLSTRKINIIKNYGNGDNDIDKVLYKGSEIDEEELDADIMKIENIKDLPNPIDEKIKYDYITFFGSDTNSLDLSQVSIIDGNSSNINNDNNDNNNNINNDNNNDN